MRKWIFFVILLIGVNTLLALSLHESNTKKIVDEAILEAGDFNLITNNFGLIGKISSNVSNLTYPKNSNINHLYIGALWVGGTKHRRNENNEKLYWKQGHFPPTSYSHDIISVSDPSWNSSLIAVIDTLVSVGFDGDNLVNELLPAYNPLEFTDINNYYYENDKVLTGIMGNPHPRDFMIPDPQNNYCFTIPNNTTITSEGYETKYSYFYDYSPFNFSGQRDYGDDADDSNHIPLGLAISQEIFTWPVKGYDYMFFIKNVIKNSSPVDTIFNFVVSYYYDADIGFMSNDDRSGCISSVNDAFAFSFDSDFDSGLAPFYVALKVLNDQVDINRCVSTWRVSNGPDDKNPLNYWNLNNKTANEKYWLMTERNPNVANYKFLNIPDIVDNNYHISINPETNDTRFLYSVYGQNSTGNVGMCLAPGESKTFYTAVFFGETIQELLSRNFLVNQFHASSFNSEMLINKPSRPYLKDVVSNNKTSIDVNWHCYSQPYYLDIHWRDMTNKSPWMTSAVPANSTSYRIENLVNDHVYQVKIVSQHKEGNLWYDPMESSIKEVQVGNIIDPIGSNNLIMLKNFPNPFNPNTNIYFQLFQEDLISLNIFNVKGEVVKTYKEKVYPQGENYINWDGTDNDQNKCASGIYFYQVKSSKGSQTKKMLMLK